MKHYNLFTRCIKFIGKIVRSLIAKMRGGKYTISSTLSINDIQTLCELLKPDNITTSNNQRAKKILSSTTEKKISVTTEDLKEFEEMLDDLMKNINDKEDQSPTNDKYKLLVDDWMKIMKEAQIAIGKTVAKIRDEITVKYEHTGIELDEIIRSLMEQCEYDDDSILLMESYFNNKNFVKEKSNMSKEIFELSGLDDFDSILGTNINEASEVNVPGGDKEHPAGVPADVSIKVPAGTTITADEYNQALTSLKKSFKEGAEIMEMLEKVTVTNQSPEERQKEFNENAMADALYEAYMSGPLYEAVSKADKDDIKDIVAKVSGTIEKTCRENKIKFKKARLLLRYLIDGSSIFTVWTARLWQILGVIYIEGGNLKEATDYLNKEFAEDLGDYKIIATQNPPSFVDLFAVKFNWKNTKNVYTLLIDTKLPSEFKKAIAADSSIKKGEYSSEEKEDKEDKKD